MSDCLITKSKLLFEIFNQVHIFVTEHLTVLYGIMHESADMHHFVVVEPPYKYAQTRNIQLMQIILIFFYSSLLFLLFFLLYRPSISQIQEAVRFQLYFQTGLPRTLFTGKGIKSVDKMRIKIAIKDANNRVVTYGPMSTLKIKIVVIKSDFNSDGKAIWSKEEFINHIILARCGKRPLLTGELEVRMQAGVACIVDASFTDISKWTRSGKFRLGAIVSDGRYGGERVQEAISEAFKVKDGRLECKLQEKP